MHFLYKFSSVSSMLHLKCVTFYDLCRTNYGTRKEKKHSVTKHLAVQQFFSVEFSFSVVKQLVRPINETREG